MLKLKFQTSPESFKSILKDLERFAAQNICIFQPTDKNELWYKLIEDMGDEPASEEVARILLSYDAEVKLLEDSEFRELSPFRPKEKGYNYTMFGNPSFINFPI